MESKGAGGVEGSQLNTMKSFKSYNGTCNTSKFLNVALVLMTTKCSSGRKQSQGERLCCSSASLWTKCGNAEELS